MSSSSSSSSSSGSIAGVSAGYVVHGKALLLHPRAMLIRHRARHMHATPAASRLCTNHTTSDSTTATQTKRVAAVINLLVCTLLRAAAATVDAANE
jgi:hypothetical protein